MHRRRRRPRNRCGGCCWCVHGRKKSSEVKKKDQRVAAFKPRRHSGTIKWPSDHRAPQADPSFIQRWLHTVGFFLKPIYNTGWHYQRREAIIPQVVTEGRCSSHNFITGGHWCKLRHCKAEVWGVLQQEAFNREGAPSGNSYSTSRWGRVEYRSRANCWSRQNNKCKHWKYCCCLSINGIETSVLVAGVTWCCIKEAIWSCSPRHRCSNIQRIDYIHG